jgi:hypothetical protein
VWFAWHALPMGQSLLTLQATHEPLAEQWVPFAFMRQSPSHTQPVVGWRQTLLTQVSPVAQLLFCRQETQRPPGKVVSQNGRSESVQSASAAQVMVDVEQPWFWQSEPGGHWLLSVQRTQTPMVASQTGADSWGQSCELVQPAPTSRQTWFTHS